MSLALQLNDYRLTTAEILYRLPDHPGILQSYIWQDLDLAPRFPVLHRFLDFWHRELDGKVHSVRVASASVIKPPSYRNARTSAGPAKYSPGAGWYAYYGVPCPSTFANSLVRRRKTGRPAVAADGWSRPGCSPLPAWFW
jgi:uncharacterized protein Usg